MIAGNRDALSLSILALSVGTITPWAAPFVAPPLAAGIAALGAAGFFWERNKHKTLKVDEVSKQKFIIASDPVPNESLGNKGVRFGITTDERKAVDINNTDLAGHTAIIGQSGVGKTTLIEYMIWQQTVRGAGWLFIDAKIDRKTRDNIAYMAKVTGREDELYVLDISDPENSNTMNPILEGDPDEVSSRLMNLVPSTESNAGSDHYKQTAGYGLTVIIGALQASKRTYHFGDLSIIMLSGHALEELERLTPEGEAKRNLKVFLNQYRRRNKDGVMIDVEKLKKELGGMAGRISSFAQGKFGKVFNVYNPDIVLEDILRQNKMLYVSLPTMAKDIAALNLAKMILSDLRSAVARLQELDESERPEIPFMAIMDEMGSYAIEGLARLFEQARSAKIALVPAFQSFSQLNQVSDNFADLIIQNTWNKVFFKFGSVDSTETAVELLGSKKRFQKSISLSANQGANVQTLRTTPESGLNDGGGHGVSWREVEETRVQPDQLRSLERGEAFCINGANFYHIKTPMIKYPKNTGRYRLMKPSVKPREGYEPLDYKNRIDEFVL